MSDITKVPSIPDPTGENTIDVLNAIKEMLEVRNGDSGNALDANVTRRDLVTLNLAQSGVASTSGGALPSVNLPLYPYSYNNGYDPVADLTPPPSPTGLSATATQSAVLLSWDQSGYRNRAYTEVWISQTTNIGDAVLAGTSTSQFYNDVRSDTMVHYYWVRDISQAGTKGPYSAGLVKAQVGVDIGSLLKQLTGQITATQLYSDLGAKIARSDPTSLLQDSVGARIYSTNLAIAEESVVRETVDGGLLAQYTVKIDAGGKVAGFGLASVGSLSTGTTSSFAVRADKFYIAPPSGGSGSDVIPFIVDTASGVVYINNAMIKTASITSAQIQNLTANKLTAGYVQAVIGINGAKVYGAELYAGGTTSASYDGNGNITGFTASNPTIAVASGNFTAVAGNFQVRSSTTDTGSVAPFYVAAGVVYLSSAIIRDGSILTAKIADAQITNAHIKDTIQSNDFSSGSSGWQINKAGQMEMNNATFRGTLNINSGISGARTEMTNQALKVYDSAGTLRVQIGNLSA